MTIRSFQTALVLAILALSTLLQPVRAANLYVYDLDSLTFMSPEIVEAEVMKRYEANKIDLIDVKVTAVHKGAFKAGQTLAVAGTDLYRKDDLQSVEHFAVGDKVILFVYRAKASMFFPIPEDAEICMPTPSGVRLVDGDNVLGFSQWMNPGPYNLDRPGPKNKPPTLKTFRQQVSESVRYTDKLKGEIDKKTGEKDAAWFLDLLAERSKLEILDRFSGRDYLSEIACANLANGHDPDVLTKALPLAKEYHGRDMLARGFGTPKGRDLLLKQVSDEKLPMERRIEFARYIRQAGAVYRSTITEITTNSSRTVGEEDEGNSGYFKRIGKAAYDNRQHEALCLALLHTLDWLGRGHAQRKDSQVFIDLYAALGELEPLYDDAKVSEPIRYTVELATVGGDGDGPAYARLRSPCGPMLSLLRAPARPEMYTKPKEPSLIFEYDYHSLSKDRDAQFKPNVVLVHQASGQRYVLPTEITCRGFARGGGSGVVVLPKDLRPGRYRVFFEFQVDGKVISTGHHFETDL